MEDLEYITTRCSAPRYDVCMSERVSEGASERGTKGKAGPEGDRSVGKHFLARINREVPTPTPTISRSRRIHGNAVH